MSSSTLEDVPLAVRFDDECVLIPEPPPHSRMPHLVKRAYSLPIWKKRSSSRGALESDGGKASVDGRDASPEDSHIHFTVAVPSFSRQSRSPTRCETYQQPLVPCLVNHDHPTTNRRVRRPSLSFPARTDVVTVPLRRCCPECYPITEESLKEGAEWQEKFTRGARRRRNSSAESYNCTSYRAHRKVCHDTPGFDHILQVDEVAKLHKNKMGFSSPSSHEEPVGSTSNDEGVLTPSLTRRSAPRDIGIAVPLSPTRPVTVSPPIEEEDEEQLFPLPGSFRRTSPASSSSDLANDIGLPNHLDKLNLSDADTKNTKNMDLDSGVMPILSPSSPSSQSSSVVDSLFTPSNNEALGTSLLSLKEPIPISESLSSSPNLTSVSPSERSPILKRIHMPTASTLLRTGADMLKGFNMGGGGSPLVV